MIVRVVRLVLGGLLLAWLAYWWLGERNLRKGNGGERGDGLAGPIRSSVLIHAPVERVWREISDVPSQPRWMRDLRSVKVETPGPIRVGSRLDGIVSLYGISVPDPIEISVWAPPLLYGVRHVGMWKGEGLIRLSLDGEGTRVEERVVYRLPFGPLGRLAHTLLVGHQLGRLWAHRRERIGKLLGPMIQGVKKRGWTMHQAEVNGQPGCVWVDTEGDPQFVVSLDIAEDKVQTIRSVANPEKLRHIPRVAR